MVELRWAVKSTTTTEPARLEYRYMQPTVDASGALCPDEWVEWREVPMTVKQEPKAAHADPRMSVTVEQFEAMRKLHTAAAALKEDLLMRAEIEQPGAIKVVACGNTAWFNFCEALAAIQRGKEST
jgi:hypothetical protein